MDYSGKLLICGYCQSYKDGKCTDIFENGVRYPCVNYVERKNADRRDHNQRRGD